VRIGVGCCYHGFFLSKYDMAVADAKLSDGVACAP
jgi:hypothetical protein